MIGSSVFVQRVGELIRRRPVACSPGRPVVELARMMSQERVGSVVVVDDAGLPIGIVTDRDLRKKVVAEARDPAATFARDIMSAPVVAVAPAAFAFEALLDMTRREIHHLAVVEDSRLVGVISTHDFLMLDTAHPVVLAREIARATSVEALASAGARTVTLVRRLVEQGGSAHDIGQLVAELNDRLVATTLALTANALLLGGEPPPSTVYCWLALGSEARREQTLRTDQDNGLVYADPPPEQREQVAAWYAHFATAAIANLVRVGFPRCPGDIMASNPRWCRPLSEWTGQFRRWMSEPEPEPVLAAQIHFDLRPIAGAASLGEALRALIVDEAPKHRLFLRLLARDVVERHVPLTVFGNVAVARRGSARGTVDIKGGAAMPLTGAARVHALELGLGVTNTVERIRAAGAGGRYRAEEVREITDAFQHVTRLRLVHQLEQIAAGELPDNAIRPDRLSRADAVLLKDALKVVRRVQAEIRDSFRTDLIR